jgi:hypothetical protein
VAGEAARLSARAASLASFAALPVHPMSLWPGAFTHTLVLH